MIERKINEMHKRFGKREGKRCKECKHCKRFKYNNKRYYKCELYGVSNGEGTDWRASYAACGMFNVHMDAVFNNVLKQIKHMPKASEEQIDGQIQIGDFE